jgi:hypothetical protein
MRRNVTEEDVAETIFSLITSNPFVTGETVVVDGGYAATTLYDDLISSAAFGWRDLSLVG